jgi:hypothetical protein
LHVRLLCPFFPHFEHVLELDILTGRCDDVEEEAGTGWEDWSWTSSTDRSKWLVGAGVHVVGVVTVVAIDGRIGESARGVPLGVLGRGCDGNGQVISFVSGEQYSRILSYKYHCLWRGRPFGKICSGKVLGDGILESDFNMANFIGGESDSCLNINSPFISLEKE